MKKVLLLFLFIPSIAFGAAWEEAEPQGTRSPSDIDTYVASNNDSLVRMLKDELPIISYSSSSAISVSAGSVMVCNAAQTDCEMLYNSSATSATSSDLDTGSSFSSSTTYYVYADGSSAADTFGITISSSASAPTGVTQYKRIGSFYVNSGGAITLINNDNITGELSGWSSKSYNTTYQAATDGYVVAEFTVTDAGTLRYQLIGYSDSSSSPTTVRARAFDGQRAWGSATTYGGLCFPVACGDYYNVTRSVSGSVSGESVNIYFISTQ